MLFRIRWLLLIPALLLSLFAMPAPASYACSCMMPGTPPEELARSDEVFLGRVTNMETVDGLRRVTFAVETIWKGATRGEIVVSTTDNSAACGFEFSAGERYVVYASAVDQGLMVSLCSRTALAADAGDDLAQLGAGIAPTTTAGSTSGAGSATNLGLFGVVGLAVVAVALMSVVIWRRRSPVPAPQAE